MNARLPANGDIGLLSREFTLSSYRLARVCFAPSCGWISGQSLFRQRSYVLEYYVDQTIDLFLHVSWLNVLLQGPWLLAGHFSSYGLPIPVVFD